tara:strand:+ start:3254 stop:3883 length:630 start_codon:yes stop_codon:yes gene_type:complete
MKNTAQEEDKKCRGRPCSYNREELVEQVMGLFWDQGFASLSLNEIAQKTGLTRASLYNAFGNKETLFLEAYKYYLEQSPYKRLGDYKDGDLVGPLLYSVANDICSHFANDEKKRGCLTINVLSELPDPNCTLGQKITDAYNEKQKIFEHLIISAIKNGELPKNTNPEITANTIMVFMSGFGIFAKNISDEQTLKDIYHNFLASLGFKPR